MSRKINFVCNACGSNELIFDTTSSWNAETQAWELEGEYEQNPCCSSETCQGEQTEFHTVDVVSGEQVENWRGEWIDRNEYLRLLAESFRQNAIDRAERDALAKAEENARLLAQAYA